MHCPNFAPIIRRGLAAALALSIPFSVAPAADAAAPSTTFLAARIFEAETGEDFMTARGGSKESDPFGEFATTAQVSRIPCPGHYVIQLSTENQDNGATSAYHAIVDLTRPPGAPSTPRCGELVPPQSGTALVVITGPHEPFKLEGKKESSAGFFGTIDLYAQPDCSSTYGLRVTVDLNRWRRSVRYRMAVDDASSVDQGQKIPLCPP
jgi:hypothetical protein